MIDWARANELKEEVGEDAFAEVIDMFLQEVEEVMDRLNPTLSAGQLADHLHFLKGSSLSLGFADFAQLCSASEVIVKEQGHEAVDLPALQKTYDDSREAFLKAIDRTS